MTITTSAQLLNQARELCTEIDGSLFRALNLIQLKYLDEVHDFMTALQCRALSVARNYWRDGSASGAELDAAGTAIWDAMNQVAEGWSIIGLEVHMTRALIGVMNSDFQAGMGEEQYCQESAEWFSKMMWNWCDLSIEECICLSHCLDVAVQGIDSRLPAQVRRHGLLVSCADKQNLAL